MENKFLYTNRNTNINNKIKFMIALALFLISLFAILASALFVDNSTLAQTLYDCGNLNTTNAVYTMNQSIKDWANESQLGACLNVMANNITIDCAGYSFINWSIFGIDEQPAINVTGYNYTTIKNCIFSMRPMPAPRNAINFAFANNGTILNNTIVDSSTSGTLGGHGIFLNLSSSSNIITNNTITINGALGHGIYLINNSNFNIISNNIIKTGTNSYGVYVRENSSYNTIIGNIINSGINGIYVLKNGNSNIISGNNITSNVSSWGEVYIGMGSSFNIISNNNITGIATSTGGIYLDTNCSNNNITGNIINSKFYGVHLKVNSSNNLIDRNNITTTSTTNAYGVYLNQSSDSNIISNNNITTSSTTAHGVYLLTDEYNNNITSNIIKATGTNADGVFLNTNASSNIISGNNISSPFYGVYIFTDSSRNDVLNNNITTTASAGYGIFLSTRSYFNNLINNTIKTGGSTSSGINLGVSGSGQTNVGFNNITGNVITINSNTAFGIALNPTNTSYNILSNNNISGTGGGIALGSNSTGNQISNININTTSSGTSIIRFSGGGQSENQISNITIRISGTASPGVYFSLTTYLYSNNNTFSGMNIITTSTANAFDVANGNNNFTIKDSTLNASNTLYYDFAISGTGSGGNSGGIMNFTNVTRANGISPITILWNASSNATLNMMWYLDIYTNYTNGTIIPNTNISVWDKNGILANTATTDSNGWARLTLLEYIRNETGGTNYTYFSNYTINATADWFPPYVNKTKSINMSGNQMVVFSFDVTPNATLISPANATHTSVDQNFTANFTDNTALKNATLHIFNSSGYEVNSTTISFSGTTIFELVGIVVHLVDGIYKWLYDAFDIYNLKTTTQNRTIVIDTVNPDITWYSPEEGVMNYTNSIDFNISASVFDLYLDAVNISVYNISGALTYNNFTSTILTTLYLNNEINLTEGNNTINICGRDSLSGSPIISTTSNFIKVSETKTTFNTYISRDFKIYDKTDKELSALSYKLSTDDLWIDSGVHFKTIWTLDELPKDSYIKLIMINSKGSMDLLTDREVTRIVDSGRNYYWKFTDLEDAGFNVQYKQIGKTVEIIVTQGKYIPVTKGTETKFILDPIVGGLNNYCENQSVHLDTINPNINFTFPTKASGLYINRNNILINVTASDVNLVNIIINLYNSSHVQINSSNTSQTNLFANFTGLADGIYYFNATAYDLAGNVNRTETRNITIDMTPPEANLTNPLNNTNTNIPTQNFTVNASDGLGLNNATLYIYNQSGALINQIATANEPSGILGRIWGIVVSLADGVYHWFYEVFDKSGNWITTGNFTLTIDTTPPYFTSIYNITTKESAEVSELITASDALNNVSCFTVNDSRFEINCSGYLITNTEFPVTIIYLNISVNDSLNNIAYGIMWVNYIKLEDIWAIYNGTESDSDRFASIDEFGNTKQRCNTKQTAYGMNTSSMIGCTGNYIVNLGG